MSKKIEIHIHINSLIDKMNVTASDINSSDEIRNTVVKTLLEAVDNAVLAMDDLKKTTEKHPHKQGMAQFVMNGGLEKEEESIEVDHPIEKNQRIGLQDRF
jgi:hypothetical protein